MRAAACHPDRPHHAHGMCRACYNKAWKKANPEKRRAILRRAHYRGRAAIWKLKDVPCADCGIKYAPWVMQFDHVPGMKKNYTIGAKLRSARARAEAAMCQVVCANCHAERTHQRLVERKGREAENG